MALAWFQDNNLYCDDGSVDEDEERYQEKYEIELSDGSLMGSDQDVTRRPRSSPPVATAVDANVDADGRAIPLVSANPSLTQPEPRSRGGSFASTMVVKIPEGITHPNNLREKHTRPRQVLLASFDTHFDAREVVAQFLYHFFYPLSLPVFLYCRGLLAAHKTGMVPVSFPSFITDFVTPLAAHGSMILYWLHREDLNNNERVTAPEVLLSFMFWLIHRAMVATKYGSLSKEEAHLYWKTTDKKTTDRWLSQAQLITGWLRPNHDVIMMELNTASFRVGVDLDEMMLLVSKREYEKRNWSDFLIDEMGKKVEQPYEECEFGTDTRIIKARTLAIALISHSTIKSQFPPWIKNFVFGTMVIQVLIGPLHRAFFVSEDERGFMFGHSAVAIFITSSCVWLTAILWPATLYFMLTAVASINRHRILLHMLGDLIRVQSEKKPNSPYLELHRPDNIRAWLYIRLVVDEFGARYKARLDLYVGTVMCLVLFLVVWLIILSLNCMAAASETYDEGGTECELRSTVMVWYGIYGVTVWTTVLLAAVTLGASANKTYANHLHKLVRHRIRIREYKKYASGQGTMSQRMSARMRTSMAGGAKGVGEGGGTSEAERNSPASPNSSTKFEEAEECDDLLDAAMQMIQGLEQATPVRVLAMRADFSLISSIIGLVGSAFAFGLQELLNAGDR